MRSLSRVNLAVSASSSDGGCDAARPPVGLLDVVARDFAAVDDGPRIRGHGGGAGSRG